MGGQGRTEKGSVSGSVAMCICQAGALGAVLLLLACVQNNSSQPAAVTPRPAPGGAPAVYPAAVDFSGTYSGIARPIQSGGGTCVRPVDVADFQVAGRSVQWGRFQGTIDANGGLQMVNGQFWVIGRFTDGTFTGRFISPGRRANFSRVTPRSTTNDCMFTLDLRRTSA